MGPVNPVYIIGAGGMGRETLDVYRDAGREAEVAGFVVEDRYWQPGTVVNGKPVHRWSELAGCRRGRPRGASWPAEPGLANRRLADLIGL